MRRNFYLCGMTIKKKYLFYGEVICGDTPDEIVQNLYDGAKDWFKPKDLKSYLDGLKFRIHTVEGIYIRIDTPQHLVDDLLTKGILKEMPTA